MLGGYRNAGTGEGQQRIEVAKAKLGCSTMEEEDGVMIISFTALYLNI
jgi:hypothetical protein